MEPKVVKSKPLSREETKSLVDLIESSKIITCKATNATSNKMKEEEWIRIAEKFNATATSCPRTSQQLRLKWENLKKNSRKRCTKIRMNNIKTGGGVGDYIPPDEILDKVISLLGSTATGLVDNYGGDKEPEELVVINDGGCSDNENITTSSISCGMEQIDGDVENIGGNGSRVNIEVVGFESAPMLDPHTDEVVVATGPSSSTAQMKTSVHSDTTQRVTFNKVPRAAKSEPTLPPLKEIDAALRACQFGRFNITLLLTSFVGFVAGQFVSSSTGYLLPVAECDLQMTLVQKGLLNAVPYLGMFVSSVVAGFLTDTFGRKIFLVMGFGGQFLCTSTAGSSQTYIVLIAAKLCEGVLFAASFSALISLTAEFCHNGIRDRIMLFQSSYAAMAQIIIALISWGMLTNDWKVILFDGRFVLNTWNFYLYAISLWPLAACIMYAVFMPESPKYLAAQKKYDEARAILTKTYVWNTGKPADTYPYANIWKDISKMELDENPENKVSTSFAHAIVVGLHNIKPMFRKPLIVYLGLIGFSNFITMMVYNVIRLWYPQLSAIVENFQGERGQDLCVMLDDYTDRLKQAELLKEAAFITTNHTTTEICVVTKSGMETYINSIIIGCVCLIPYLVVGILVNKVGKKRLITAAGLLCICTTLGLRFSNTKTIIVILFAATIAVSQALLSLNSAVIVQVFDTTTRTLAISLMMLTGRIGTLAGNILFPILLNMGCIVPFFTISGLMVAVTLFSFFLPVKK